MKITKTQLTNIIAEAVKHSNYRLRSNLNEEAQTSDGAFIEKAMERLQGNREFADAAKLFVSYLASFKDEQATLASLRQSLAIAAVESGIDEAQATKFAAVMTRVLVAMAAAKDDARAEQEAMAQQQQ